MAINFPTSPNIDDTHSASGKTWKYDGTSWNLVIASTSVGDAGAKGDKGEKADDSPQEFDMFWLAVVSSVTQNGTAYNSEVIGDGNTRTGNMGRVTSTGFAKSGAGMSENNGVFNFPTTGQWSVKSEVFGYGRASAQVSTDFTVRINYSSDGGSTWTDVSEAHTTFTSSSNSYPKLGHSTQEYIFNITDLAQQQVRFLITSDGPMQIDYPSGQPTRFIFHKLEGMIGDKGQEGDKGTKGEEGVGTKGEIGAGEKGVKGEKGLQSTVPGAKGDTGDKGEPSTVAGPKGEPGDKGDIGDKGQKGATGTAAASASFTNLNVTGISTLGDTGIGHTVGIGSTAYFGDGGLHLQGVLTGRTSGNKIRINSHIIPEANAQYDLGNAEYKIRHLFLSDNSIKFVGQDTAAPQSWTINATSSGASSYTINGTDANGVINNVANATVTVRLGDTLNFNVSANGHPFWIKTAASTGTGNGASGVTNNGAQTGTVSFTPTGSGAVGTYYYICQYHGSMVGTINVGQPATTDITRSLNVDSGNLMFDGKQVLGNVVLDGVDNNDTISWNGTNWVNVPPSGSPGGSTNQLQINNGSGFGGTNLKYSANLDGSLEWTNAGGVSGARISCYHDTISGGDNSIIFYAGGGMLGTLNMRIFNNSVTVYGSLTKGSGSFRIPHPLAGLSTTKDLVHSFIEGPQCDNLYRGKIDLVGGTATVNLDTKSDMTAGTFVALNRDVQCFTTNESGWTAVKGSVSGNTLTITAQDNSCTDTISWMVIGERQDDNIKSSSLTDATGKLIMEPNQIPLPPTS